MGPKQPRPSDTVVSGLASPSPRGPAQNTAGPIPCLLATLGSLEASWDRLARVREPGMEITNVSEVDVCWEPGAAGSSGAQSFPWGTRSPLHCASSAPTLRSQALEDCVTRQVAPSPASSGSGWTQGPLAALQRPQTLGGGGAWGEAWIPQGGWRGPGVTPSQSWAWGHGGWGGGQPWAPALPAYRLPLSTRVATRRSPE